MTNVGSRIATGRWQPGWTLIRTGSSAAPSNTTPSRFPPTTPPRTTGLSRTFAHPLKHSRATRVEARCLAWSATAGCYIAEWSLCRWKRQATNREKVDAGTPSWLFSQLPILQPKSSRQRRPRNRLPTNCTELSAGLGALGLANIRLSRSWETVSRCNGFERNWPRLQQAELTR